MKSIVTSDWHINDANRSTIMSVVDQIVSLAESRGITRVYFIGDMFTSKKSQSLYALRTMQMAIDKILSVGAEIYAIAGNHDKVRHDDDFSYLSVVSGMNVFDSVGVVDDTIVMIPYYESNKYLNIVKSIDLSGKIVLTHIGIIGALDNGGSDSGAVDPDIFNDAKIVIVGHYHNRYSYKNIVYSGSTDQRGYGEDAEKGCVVLDDDSGSIEYVNFEFPVYDTIVATSGDSLKKISESVSLMKDSGVKYVRVILDGCDVDPDNVKRLGVDKVVAIRDDARIDSGDIDALAQKYSKSDIPDLFEEFLIAENIGDDEKSFCKT